MFLLTFVHPPLLNTRYFNTYNTPNIPSLYPFPCPISTNT